MSEHLSGPALLAAVRERCDSEVVRMKAGLFDDSLIIRRKRVLSIIRALVTRQEAGHAETCRGMEACMCWHPEKCRCVKSCTCGYDTAESALREWLEKGQS